MKFEKGTKTTGMEITITGSLVAIVFSKYFFLRNSYTKAIRNFVIVKNHTNRLFLPVKMFNKQLVRFVFQQ